MARYEPGARCLASLTTNTESKLCFANKSPSTGCMCGVCGMLVCGGSDCQAWGAMAQSAPRSPSKGEIMGSIPIGAILLFLLGGPSCQAYHLLILLNPLIFSH